MRIGVENTRAAVEKKPESIEKKPESIKVNYLVLSYLCLAHLLAASAFLLPLSAERVALAVVTIS